MPESPNNKPTNKVSQTEWFLVAILAAATVLSFLAGSTRASGDGLLHVYFLSVGQGDASFIQTPGGSQILIDGGPDSTILHRLGEVMPFHDRSIDLVILSHPHTDHVVGLIDVLKRYDVGQIIESYPVYDAAEYDEWNKLKLEAEVKEAEAGQVLDFGDGVRLTMLLPHRPESGESKTKDPHDYMVVARLDYGSESVIFTGDMEGKLERRLLSERASISAQFLKVGHHGSKTSTTEEFLRTVNPIVAFMSLGAKNRYGHPHQSVTERLEKFGIKYYRTDRDGSSDLQLDGTKYLINNF